MSTRAKRFALLMLAISAAAVFSSRRSTRQDYAAVLDSGTKLLEKKEFVQAILQFRTAARLSPKNAEPLYRLGLAYLASGSTSEGVTALVKAADIDPKHASAQVKLAELLAGSTDKKLLEAGQQRLQEVLSVKPANTDALTALALTESRLGNLQGAEEHLRAALATSPSSLKAAVVLARIKLARRDIPGAEQALRSAIQEFEKLSKQDPADRDARTRLVASYLAVHRDSDADRVLASAPRKNPGDVDALLLRSEMQVRAGETSVSAGLQSLQQYAVGHPGSARVQYFLGERMLAALPSPAGGGPAAQLLLAAAEHKSGNRRAAEQLYRKVLQADPSQVVALNNLASLLAEYENRSDETLKYAQQARELAPDNPDMPEANEARAALRGAFAAGRQ